MSQSFSTTKDTVQRMTLFLVMLALVASAFVSNSAAQRRATPSLTSEDLLDARSVSATGSTTARRISSVSSARTSASTFYRDPTGAFSLRLPNAHWQLNAKSQAKRKLFDQRTFRKLDTDGFASATASVYVLTSTTALSIGEAARFEGSAQRELAQTLATRFLSNNASVVSIDAGAADSRANFQVIADQLVARRVVVRALISAFEHQGRLFIVVCRAPLEGFDAEASEFLSITQSLASSVARSS